ncbi:MAG: FecR domain-containing protein [Deltaproteobacteria bacterium]|nr:FecR domain-containing protein [Deltaproteobacteria bacterium]MDQ3298158.1 FecR family protein [Myxococcota bacterium]
MKHVAPHRWADAEAGRVDAAARAAMDRHADGCSRCARARDRIKQASASFAAIKSHPAPELPWDAVRARIHWSVSTERRERLALEERAPARRWIGTLALATAAAGALVIALVTDGVRPAQLAGAPRTTAPAEQPQTPVMPPAPAEPTALAGLVNRTTGDVMIDGIRPDDLFARRLVAGSVIATGDGRVDIQFADASAFALGPRSMIELRRFDADAIELVVEGTVDIEVAPRAPHQRFLVLAGDRTIEVRGTQFRVRQEAGNTTVACRHGLVAVRDAKGQVDVGAARRVELAAAHTVTIDRVRPLSVDEVNDLAAATPLTLPVFDRMARSQANGWFGALLEGSAPLEIATASRREVRINGVELGSAPMRVRVMPGRHMVEAADAAGRFRRVGWVDVATPRTGSTSQGSRLEIPAEPRPTRGVQERRRQLLTGHDKARVALCMRSIAKSGLTGTYVVVEIAVDGAGAIGFLNVLDTDLPSTTASCVRDVLVDVRFGSGAPASWRERLDL